MESGRWMNFFCHSMQRQEDSPPATDCRLGDGPCISTCALLVESDGGGRKTWRYIMEFQSTLSSRRATCFPHGGYIQGHISIHALLAESDTAALPPTRPSPDFNPRSPCGERPGTSARWSRPLIFQSTLSLRRATSTFRIWRSWTETFQSTLSLRRATCAAYGFVMSRNISIHALLAESDARQTH